MTQTIDQMSLLSPTKPQVKPRTKPTNKPPKSNPPPFVAPPKPSNLMGLDGFPFTKPRYTWTDAPGWWNPLGEEIDKEEGDLVQLAYQGRFIPRSELIEVIPSKVSGEKSYNSVADGAAVQLSELLK